MMSREPNSRSAMRKTSADVQTSPTLHRRHDLDLRTLGEDVVPLRPGDLHRRLDQRAAGIVDQHADVAEGLARGGEALRDVGLAAQIERR